MRDLHRAELGPAHRAEVRRLRRLLRQRRVVVGDRRDRVERQVELVAPAELEARLGQSVVAQLRARVALGEVGGVGRDLVGDHALLDVVAVGEAQVLLGRDVAEQGGPGRADGRRANRRRDVVVAWGDVRGQRAQGVEGRLGAPVELLGHVLRDLVERDVAGALVHHLRIKFLKKKNRIEDDNKRG